MKNQNVRLVSGGGDCDNDSWRVDDISRHMHSTHFMRMHACVWSHMEIVNHLIAFVCSIFGGWYSVVYKMSTFAVMTL